MDFEIYFDDLKEETQKELLKAMKIKDLSEANWDTYPIVILETID